MKNREERVNTLTLALGIALLPPIWAVLSGHLGITTGAVALICAGVYVAHGNKTADALKIFIGFLLGDLWAYIAVHIMAALNINPDLELFLTLCIMGGLAVLIGSLAPKWIFTPAWLCGWAIGLTIIGPLDTAAIGTLPLQIAAAMAAGVFYVGVGVDAFQRWIARLILKKK